MLISAFDFIKNAQQNNIQLNHKVFIFCGEDPCLYRDSYDFLITYLQQKQYKGFDINQAEKNKYNDDSNFEIKNIAELFATRSLFATQSFIEIYLNKLPTTKSEQQTLISTLANKENFISNLLIIRVYSFEAIKLSKFVDSLASHTCIINAKTLYDNQYPKWISFKANEFNFTINLELNQIIQDSFFNNLLAISNIFEKLSLENKNIKTLKLQDLEIYLQDQSQYKVFALSDYLLNGNKNKIRSVLQNLALSPIENLPGTIWVLLQDIRRLISLKIMKGVEPFGKTANRLKIWSSKYQIYENAIQKIKFKNLKQALIMINQIDINKKGIDLKIVNLKKYNTYSNLYKVCLKILEN